jgi:hypothetical protein
MNDEKEKEKSKVEDDSSKKKSNNLFSDIPPGFIIIGAAIIFFIWKGISFGEEGSTQQIFILLIIIGIAAFISKTKDRRHSVITPKRAEILTEMMMERKKQFGQLHTLDEYHIQKEIDLAHIDERGHHYNVGVVITNPYRKPEYYVSKVVARGDEQDFATLIQTKTKFTGREVRHQKRVLNKPPWIGELENSTVMQKLWGLHK